MNAKDAESYPGGRQFSKWQLAIGRMVEVIFLFVFCESFKARSAALVFFARFAALIFFGRCASLAFFARFAALVFFARSALLRDGLHPVEPKPGSSGPPGLRCKEGLF